MVGIRQKSTLGLLILTSLVGLVILSDYSSRPSPSTPVPTTLTSQDFGAIQLENNKCSVLLFFHPRCPCTMATATSLLRLHSQLEVPTYIHAFAYCPNGEKSTWIETEITKTLRSIEGLEVHLDRDGNMCRQYRANTSGHLLVYSSEGHLIFSGGISIGRGHEGESISSRLLVRQINERASSCVHRPVFGCGILPL